MTRMELENLAKQFLRTYGYGAKSTGAEHAWIFTRPTGVGTVTDELLLYFHEKGDDEESLSNALYGLDERYRKIPEDRRFFLAPVPLGRVPQVVTETHFLYQVPGYFFDREFSSARKNTPLRRLEEDARRYEAERVAQPYEENAKRGAGDLLEHLVDDIVNASGPWLRVIVAPAGYGKSVLMSSLYGRLGQRFRETKNQQQIGRRPLLMLPGHLKEAPDLPTLINNFIGEEFDYGVFNERAFAFWIKNDFAVWLLDGVEELVLRIGEDFLYGLLEEFLLADDSRSPQIVLAVRSPVLASSPEFRSALEDWEGDGVRIYRLASWSGDERHAYFEKNLSPPQPERKRFVDAVEANSGLTRLCSVPYYCSLVAHLRNDGDSAISADEFELVKHAFEKLCQREFDKGLDRELLPVQSQQDLLSELAEESWPLGVFSKQRLSDWADTYLEGASKDIHEQQSICLLRHALLSDAGEALAFTQEIMREYLVALRLRAALQNSRVQPFDAREIEPGSFIEGYLVREIPELIQWDRLIDQATSLSGGPNHPALALRNLLRILLGAGLPQLGALFRHRLAGQNLTGLVFQDLDMSGGDFRQCRLADTRFERCTLTNVNFSGCELKNAVFDTLSNLRDAQFEGCLTESVGDEKKLLFDRNEIRRFLFERTEVPTATREPCEAVVDVRKVLEKLVRKGKGFRMPRKFLAQVKCGGRTQPGSYIVDEAIKRNILAAADNHVMVRVAEFDDIRAFIHTPTAANFTGSIRSLLDTTCRDTALGCRHVTA